MNWAEMTPDRLAGSLAGKVIQSVASAGDGQGYVSLESITMIDGDIVRLSGSRGMAHIDIIERAAGGDSVPVVRGQGWH